MLRFCGSEKWELIITICGRSVSYEINQFKAFSLLS